MSDTPEDEAPTPPEIKFTAPFAGADRYSTINTEALDPADWESAPPDLWEDREAARKINGLYANRMFVQPLSDGMVRLNFGEIFDEEPTYHTAIVMTALNAAAFSDLILSVAKTALRLAHPVPSEDELRGEGHGEG